MAALEKVDAVVIGAGAVGSTYADALTKAGKRVVMLEFGPDWANKDFISSEIWGRRLKHSPPYELQGKNPVGYGFNVGWGSGGSMMHYYANFPRMMAADFRMKTLYGRGFDWPMTDADLAPYYDRVARELGVSGDAEQEKRWRPVDAPYPMPPLQTFRHAEIWRSAFENAGVPLAPTPTAINSVEYNGRPACVNDGWCHVGCPIGAHGTPHWSHLQSARAQGLELRPFCTVTRLLTNDKGDRVTGVEYIDPQGAKQVQETRAVALAAYSAETPRIMLNSANSRHPNGLSNRNGLVGKYVMCHTGATIWGLFDEPVDNHMGTTATQLMSFERYAKDRSPKGFGSAFWTLGNSLKPNAGLAGSRPDLFGKPLDDFMRRAARGLARVNCNGEELPRAENRVELSSEKDENGLAIARMIHTYDDDAVGVWRNAIEEGLAIGRATGAKEVWGGGAAPPTIHMNGGMMMGANAADSVTDGYGRPHEIENLFVGGSCLFPTEGAVHPTNTLMALAIRGAERMVADWGAVSG